MVSFRILGLSTLMLAAWSAPAKSSVVAFTNGSMTIAASWTGGDPTPGYENPFAVWSNNNSVSWSDLPGYTNASLPLAIGAGYVQSYASPTSDLIYISNSFHWGFSDMRTRAFSYECRQIQDITLTDDWYYTRYFNDNYNGLLGPFYSATVLRSDGTTLDLLSGPSTGILTAGSYRIETYINEVWSSDIQLLGSEQFPDLATTLNLQLSLVPAPGTIALLPLVCMTPSRRRRGA